MSYIIYLDKNSGEPVRQMVPSNPESAARYRRMTVFTQDEVDDMLENADTGECCPDCRSEHYNEGYADGERVAEGTIDELREVVQGMADGIESIECSLSDMKAHALDAGVTV